MVTGHFGLDEGPFHGKAEGQDVFVGPGQAPVVARIKNMLALSDAVVVVTGPVGVGKTTLARHAIAGISGKKIVIPIDRMRLAPDEVLELLLARFDVSRQPQGTIQRFAAFRRLLQERLADDTRVFIVAEDAERIGVDALLELEALTATDSGDSVGASIVLMGSDELPALLAKPALIRLRQRIRLRQAVTPFTAADVGAYMRHCLEAAGGVLEQIFEAGTPEIVWRYSGGVARVVDNLCESALEAAAEAGLATILPEFLEVVAGNCGLESLPAVRAGNAHSASEPRAADAGAVDAQAAPGASGGSTDSRIDQLLPALIERLQASATEGAVVLPPDAVDAPLPGAVHDRHAAADDRPAAANDDFPADPQAKAKRESGGRDPGPDAGRAAAEDSGEVSGTVSEQAAGTDPMPAAGPVAAETTLSLVDESGGEPDAARALLQDDECRLAPDDITDVLIGDGESEAGLDALQAAIHAANAWQAGDSGHMAESPDNTAQRQEPDAGVPEITLDRALARPEPAAGDAERFAEELSKATSLEDISDMLAETLFGSEELESIGAEIGAERRAAKPAAGTEEPSAPLAKAKPSAVAPQAAAAGRPARAAAIPATPTAKQPAMPGKVKPAVAGKAGDRSPAAPGKTAPGKTGTGMTRSQRIDMLNSLNKGRPAMPRHAPPVAEIVLAEEPDFHSPAAAPKPTAAQIDTAITRTRLGKAETARLAAGHDDPDDDDDRGSRRLFGLFRRPSKR